MPTIDADELRPVRLDTHIFVHLHGWGLVRVRPLHDLDEWIHDRLLIGAVDPLIDELPDELATRLKGEPVHEVVRFFTAWVHAGNDYELAAWAAWVSLLEEMPTAATETEQEVPISLAVAEVLADDVDEIGRAIAEEWVWDPKEQGEA